MTREPAPPTKENLTAWLQYFEDLRLGGFYRDRGAARGRTASPSAATSPLAAVPDPQTEISNLKSQMAKSKTPSTPASRAASSAPAQKTNLIVLPSAQSPSLFQEFESVPNDSLERIRADIG